MLLEISEYDLLANPREEPSSLFSKVSTLYFVLGTHLDLDGAYDENILVLRNYSYDREEMPVHTIGPSISDDHRNYLYALAKVGCSPLPTGTLSYMALNKDKPHILKMLKKSYGLKISSLTALRDMGVDGIGPSTTAL